MITFFYLISDQSCIYVVSEYETSYSLEETKCPYDKNPIISEVCERLFSIKNTNYMLPEKCAQHSENVAS